VDCEECCQYGVDVDGKVDEEDGLLGYCFG